MRMINPNAIGSAAHRMLIQRLPIRICGTMGRRGGIYRSHSSNLIPAPADVRCAASGSCFGTLSAAVVIHDPPILSFAGTDAQLEPPAGATHPLTVVLRGHRIKAVPQRARRRGDRAAKG